MKVLFAGGGTLGPVVPLIAVAEVLKAEGVECVFVGTSAGPDGAFVHAAGFEHRAIPEAKLARGEVFQALALPVRLAQAYRAARLILSEVEPSVVLGAGGFTEVPVAFAAHRMGFPVVLHQQDVLVSLSNRIAARWARRVTVALPESRKDFSGHPASVTGNPVRATFARGNGTRGRKSLGFAYNRPLILVMGGGTGAAALNRLVVASLPMLLEHTQVLHLTGTKRGFSAPQQPGYRAFERLTSTMPDAVAAADGVVMRAGFSALSELLQTATPVLVVPIPRSHQEANARYFANRNAVTRVDQARLTPSSFAESVSALLAFDRGALAKARKPFAWGGAASAVATVVLEAARG